MFRALVFPELIDSDEERETESDGQGKTRSWLEKEKNSDIMQILWENY